MMRNVEYSTRPERYVYEQFNGLAHLTFADNIRETVNENGEDCWLCDLYTLVLRDTDNMVQRLERSYDAFLAKAKAEEAETKAGKVTTEERVEELEQALNALLEGKVE